MQQEQWSSTIGFLLASIGAAVGLGNIWRFPAVVGQNGGGAYLIPYFIAAFAFGVPLMILEMSIGRDLRADVVTAFRQIRSEYEIIGWVISGAVLVILSYYLVITGWVLSFLVFTAGGFSTSFSTYTNSYLPVGAFILCTILVGGIVSFGVKKGIERIATILIPLVFVVLFGLAFYATQLSGFGQGISFFLTPDFAVLSNPLIWSAAFGQVFFSLSVGQGIMLTYGSYLSDDTNIPKSTLMITVADLTVAVLAGLVIFPIVFTMGLQPTMGTELAFSSLPQAFSTMPFGQIVGVAFFGALFVAAITPSVSMLEVGVAAVTQTTALNRRHASLVMTVIILFAGLPSALSYSAFNLTLFGDQILDLLDNTVGSLGLPISALLIAIVFTWIQDTEAIDRQLGESIVLPIMKYVVPTVLITVTGLRLALNVDFPAWHRVPGIEYIGNILQVELTIVVLLSLAIIGFLLMQYFNNRGKDSPQG